ncbi:hypothetical protein SLS62_002627 [Diatrype stigma]|uniref:Vacuolar protein sorting-associated protein 51 homolog n=1 Tax=Diatrype stigma TaxID=117547 RepID=A0AAN9UU90_9PEZI
MSTIASPRDPGTPFPPRRMPSSSSTTRPSLEIPAGGPQQQRQRSRSPNASTAAPTPGSPSLSATTNPGRAARNNRAALREYYKLPKGAGAGAGTPTSPLPAVEVTDPLGMHMHQLQQHSEIAASELDAPGFAAAAYVGRALAESSLEELLRTYARVVGETRALDAEKKALVYDNYSKLISATETIRRMRSTMDPLNPMASTLDPAIAQIYTQASSIRDSLRERLPAPRPPSQPPPPVLAPTPSNGSSSPPTPPTATSSSQTDTTDAAAAADTERRKRTKQLALAALEAPDKVRALVAAGRADEARRAWKMPRRLLVLWRDKGLGGGADVEACIADGDAALRGDQNGNGAGDGEKGDGD